MIGYRFIRLRKMLFILRHPTCWKGFWFRVAPSIEHEAILERVDCNLILDVGANRGQFSLFGRMVKPGVSIIAFEPIPAEADIFRRVTAGFKNVQLHQVALGEKNGEAEFHLSHRSDSSSLLEIGDRQKKLYPDTFEIGTLKVPVKKLDDFKSEWEKHSRIFLKIDVQGFELSVLRGAIETLKNCAYVYLECSETELYTGQALYQEIINFLRDSGFKLEAQCNETMEHGKLVHADCLFTRI